MEWLSQFLKKYAILFVAGIYIPLDSYDAAKIPVNFQNYMVVAECYGLDE